MWRLCCSEPTANLLRNWPGIDCCCCKHCVPLNELLRARAAHCTVVPWWIPDDSTNGWSCDAIISIPAALFSRWAVFPIQASEIESSLIQTCKSHYAFFFLHTYILLLEIHNNCIILFNWTKIAPWILSYNHIWQLVEKVKPGDYVRLHP